MRIRYLITVAVIAGIVFGLTAAAAQADPSITSLVFNNGGMSLSWDPGLPGNVTFTGANVYCGNPGAYGFVASLDPGTQPVELASGGDPNSIQCFIQEEGEYPADFVDGAWYCDGIDIGGGDPPVYCGWGADSPWASLEPSLAAPSVSATWNNGGVALDVTPPSLPSGATVWGYLVYEYVDGTYVGQQSLGPVDGQAPTSPLEVSCGSVQPSDCSYTVVALIGDPTQPSYTWTSPASSLAQVSPSLAAPSVSATWNNGGVALDVTPPSLPSGATVWGYLVYEYVDGTYVGQQSLGPVDGQAPTSPLEVSCGSVQPSDCSYTVVALIGDPTQPSYTWTSPASSLAQVSPSLAAPSVSATWNNGGVALDVTPPSLPSGATVWGYLVYEYVDGTYVGQQSLGPVDGQAPTSPLEVSCGSVQPSDCSYTVVALIGDPTQPSYTWTSPASSLAQVSPSLAAPSVSATWNNGGVALDVTPPSLPSGATVWGYLVYEYVDGTYVGQQSLGPVDGQAPTSPLEVSCGSVQPSDCSYTVVALIGDPTQPSYTWTSPASSPVSVNAPACAAVPSVTTQPSSQTVTAPAAATFTAAGSNSDPDCQTLTVQWQVSTDGGLTWSNDTADSGSTTGTLTVGPTSASMSGNEYRAVFTNELGSTGSTDSSAATLTVNTPACAADPSVTTNPSSQTVTAPAAATFTAAGSNSDPNCHTLTVQWQVSTDGGLTWSNDTTDSGNTTGTLTVGPTSASMSGNEYRVVFTNELGSTGSTDSSAATLTVNTPACAADPSVTTQPSSQTVTAPAAATFTAAGSNSDPNCHTLTVQWQVSTDGGATWSNDTTDSGNTTGTLTVGPTSASMSGNEYRVVFTNELGSTGSTDSSAATLTVDAEACVTDPSVTTQPSSQTVTAPAAATFTAAGSNSDPNCHTLTVQWQVSTDGGLTWSNDTADSGNTTGTLTVGPTSASMSGNEYRVVFTNELGSTGSTDSSAATLTLTGTPACAANPLVTTNPSSQTVTDLDQVATFTAAGSNNGDPNCHTLTVQWQVSTDGGATWSNDTTDLDTTSPTLLIVFPSLSAGNEYRAVFTNEDGSTYSSAATLRVKAPPACAASPAITTQPSNQTVTAPAAATFTAAGSTPANCAAPSVQWSSEAPGATTFTKISGATSASYTTPATTTAQSGTKYEATFTNAHGSRNTRAATLTVKAPPVCAASPAITTQPSNQTVTAPAAATFTAAGSTPANCAAPSVQWSSEAPGATTFTKISGATSASYTTPATTTAQSGTKYEATFTNAHGSRNTRAATLTVKAPPVCAASPAITTQPSNQTVTAPAAATFTAAGSTPANCAAPSVQWSSEAPGATTFTKISGATSASYTTPATTTAQSGTKYEATFTNAHGSRNTRAATLTVK